MNDDTYTNNRGDRYPIGPGPWCGTSGGYSNHKCRCDECRAANRIFMRGHRRLQIAAAADTTWVILDFPVALVARQAFPNDTEAINAAYGDTP